MTSTTPPHRLLQDYILALTYGNCLQEKPHGLCSLTNTDLMRFNLGTSYMAKIFDVLPLVKKP